MITEIWDRLFDNSDCKHNRLSNEDLFDITLYALDKGACIFSDRFKAQNKRIAELESRIKQLEEKMEKICI